ncbi:MAG TPA: OmpA family protein [Candidatus Limnocylindrales bacterium]|nr:OmpA family protein [Candidatus Limnocylindrales bacterium]
MICVLLAAVAGCTGRGQGSTAASPAPEASTATTAAASATPPAAESPAANASGTEATPVVVPTNTPEPNLLVTGNGTVLRSYSPAALDRMNDGNLGDAAHGIGVELPDDAKPPFVFVFELPAVAKISEFEAALRAPPDKGPAPNVTFAVSTTGADSGFNDVGTISGTTKTLTADVQARWVRVTANQLFDSVGATGVLAAPPAALDPTGIYIEDRAPEKNGALVMSGAREGDQRARFVAVGSALTATECTQSAFSGVFTGQFAGRTWSSSHAGNGNANPAKIRAVVNDDASIIAGMRDADPVVFMRTSEKAAFCVPRVQGTGAHHVLVLDGDPVREFYPATSDRPLDGYTFEAIGAGMLDAGALAGKEAVITRAVCKMRDLMTPQQIALLQQWVAAGHKLILGGVGCGGGSDFTWLPYPFTSAGSGPESTHASLIQVENDALGTNDKNDAAHYVDVLSYVHAQNTLDSAQVVTATDTHWCGHAFVAKTTNLNGFVQMYAVDGKGLLLYDGFNGDDANASLRQLRKLELALPVPADLPCSQNVTESFILEPSQEGTFAAGSARQMLAAMELLANQGWNGHVTVKATGDLRATVSPAAFDMAGGTQNLDVRVNVPASAKAGVYTVNVVADNGSGKTAQASYSLTGTAPLSVKTIPKAQKKIRIYGIHFDVDSAHIQPRSETVIAGIADYMRATPALRFEVQGHTDSDGGAVYNLGLSQRRAQAVVDDLVARYRIARARLKAKGYGLTQPVATNATAAGKALNRRVELLRLQ